MYELAMMEWLVIVIVFTVALSGTVLGEVRKARAAQTAPAHAVSINQSGEGS